MLVHLSVCAKGIFLGSIKYGFHYQKNLPNPRGFGRFLEQDTGVEPAFTAWEAVVLPIYESCVGKGIIAKQLGKFNCFLSKEKGPKALFMLFAQLRLEATCPADK